MIRGLILCASLALGGCATVPDAPEPHVDVSGPKFAATQFDCGLRPLPPAPSIAESLKAGSAGSHYENDLGTWGQSCSNKLRSVGSQLRGAGQVVDPSPSKGN